MTINIKDKISKLLALSESPVEAEAQAALLKAKELMIKHKLSMKDIQGEPIPEVIEVMTDVTCSKRRDPWILDLGNIIAGNHCCQSFFRRKHRAQSVTVGFWGFEDDVVICKQVFVYALHCVEDWINSVRKRVNWMYDANMLRSICDSYAEGYIDGIRMVYRKQEEQHQEWGLVVVTPREVQEKANKVETVDFEGKSHRIKDIYEVGFEDGVKFDPTTKIEQ